MVRLLFCLILSAAVPVAPAAQLTQPDRSGARQPNKRGWDLMRGEKFEQAIKAFQLAVEADPTFEMPL